MFYLIEKTTTAAGTAKAIWDKPSLDAAVISLHQTMASAMANAEAQTALTMIIDEKGAVQRYEYWVRPDASE